MISSKIEDEKWDDGDKRTVPVTEVENLNIGDFDNYIDGMILARGYQYYKNGHVIKLVQTAADVFEAKVKGTEIYTVKVKLDDEENIIFTWCNCPYDLGEYCKHQAAVFLLLQEMKKNVSNVIIDAFPDNISLESVLKNQVPQSISILDLKQALSERPQAELVELLLDIASDYEEIKQRLALDFMAIDDEEEIARSIKLIRTYIDNNSDSDGFVYYEKIYEAIQGAELVLDKARAAFDNSKTMHAIDLTLCIIPEMMNLLGGIDDTDAVVIDIVQECLDFIAEIIEAEELTPHQKEILFNKLMEHAPRQKSDYAWNELRLDLLRCCTMLADNPELRVKLENHLSALINLDHEDSWDTKYFIEKVNLIRYHLVEQYDGPKKAREFIEQNLQYPYFRKIALENALQKNNYSLVIKLALDGEKQDQNLPGLVNDWKGYRYKALKLSGKLDEQRRLAIDFILDGSYAYYKELKDTYDSKAWSSVYPQIIAMLEKQNKNYLPLFPGILIEEGEKFKLLEYVQQRPSLIEDYYQHLLPEYEKEVYTLFQQYILQTAARANKRKDYQAVCDIIRNLKKAGGIESALEIKHKLLAQYPSRPAFKDELGRV